MLNANIGYWFIFGTIYLIILMYQDYKNRMLVDDRFNYTMIGVTLSLFSHIGRPWYYTILTLIFLIILGLVIKKYEIFGEADVKSLSWMFLGYAIISPVLLFWFWVVFGVLTVTYFILKLYVFKYKKPTPFYGVILLSYITTNIIFT